MSCCSRCGQEIVVNVPGVKGDPGAAGINGQNAFTVTTADFILPAANANVTVAVASSLWMAIGQNVIVSDGANIGNFQVVSFPSANGVVLKWLDYPGDSVTTTTITSGASVSPSGILATITAPTGLTDNSGGSASDTIAVVTAPDAITDSTGGTPSATFAAITAPGANATTSLTADMTAVKNALSQIALNENADRAAIQSLTDAVASLTAKINAIISAI